MIKLMQRMMLSCKKATELVEKKSLVDLSWREKAQLSMHTSMCDACSAYKKQSELLDKILYQQYSNDQHETIVLSENKNLKERIISAI